MRRIGAEEQRRHDNEVGVSSSAIRTFRTKTDIAYETLRQAILAGEYPPGARIVADRIAETLGISAVPVREAIVRLTGEGVLENAPHRGARVAVLRPHDVQETAIMRAAVEPTAVRHAMPHVDATLLQEMRAVIAQMDETARRHPERYPALNFRFHGLTFQACPYPALRRLAMSLLERSLRMRPVHFLPEHIPQWQREHRAILHCVERGNADRIEALCRRHIEDAGRLLADFAAKQERTT